MITGEEVMAQVRPPPAGTALGRQVIWVGHWVVHLELAS